MWLVWRKRFGKSVTKAMITIKTVCGEAGGADAGGGV